MSDEHDLSGESFGPYTFIEKVGDGHMGEVWKSFFNPYRCGFFRKALYQIGMFYEESSKIDVFKAVPEGLQAFVKRIHDVYLKGRNISELGVGGLISLLDYYANILDSAQIEVKEQHYSYAKTIMDNYLRHFSKSSVVTPDDVFLNNDPDAFSESNLSRDLGNGYGNFNANPEENIGGHHVSARLSDLVKRRYALPTGVRAVKFMKYTADDEKNKRRFRREIGIMEQLSHQNIVNVIEGYVKDNNGLSYIVMEFVDSLRLEENEVNISDAALIAKGVLEGMIYLHEKGIVHADIKPHNILADLEDRVVKLTDFGIAKFLNAERAQQITQTNDLTGTPSFISPEQVNGVKANFASDVYSLGATFFYLLTGEYHTGGKDQTIYQVLMSISDKTKKTWVREHDKGKGVSYELEDVVLMMLAIKPKDRLTEYEVRFLLDDLIKNKKLSFSDKELPKPKKTRLFGDKLSNAEFYEHLGYWYGRDINGAKKRRDAFSKAVKLYKEAIEKGSVFPERQKQLEAKISLLEKRVVLEELRIERLGFLSGLNDK